jgi:glycosyltransferase involved in cell wall biosynthesis
MGPPKFDGILMKLNEHSYSRGITNKKIAILGIYPPPFGGVSVHIQRVADQFLQQNNTVYLFATEQWLRRICFPIYLVKLLLWILIKRPQYIYYHSSYLNFSIAELVVLSYVKSLLRFSMTVVDHDCRHLYTRSDRYKQWYMRVLQAEGCALVCIGDSTWKSYLDAGIKPSSFTIEQAFLPPVEATAHLIRQTYPSSLFTFLDEYTPLIAVSAAYVMLIQGSDVYGLDLCIDMLAGIKARYPDAGLVIGLPQVRNEIYFEVLQQRMKEKGVAEQIYILHGNKEFWPLFERVDLFVRPTLSDGDSVSIREALHFQIPVVASDVVVRPTGVHCFKAGDVGDFTITVEAVLQNCVYGGAEDIRKVGRL